MDLIYCDLCKTFTTSDQASLLELRMSFRRIDTGESAPAGYRHLAVCDKCKRSIPVNTILESAMGGIIAFGTPHEGGNDHV